jgi:hypothetical protein
VGGGFDRLVGGAILTETDRIVGGDPDNLVVAESRETNSAGSIADEVLEEDQCEFIWF